VDDLIKGLDSLMIVALVAALAPLLSALVPGGRVPQVVVMILGGILIGPKGLGLAETAPIQLFSNVGLGFVFLLAGYELDLKMLRESTGRLALIAWVITAVVATALVGVLETVGFVRAFVPVALGLTTTSLGALLPILRENDMLGGRFGRYVIAAGATGELLPILAIALFLGTNNSYVALLSLVAMALLALLLTQAPRVVQNNRLGQIILAGEHATAQTTLRWSIVLLLVLLAAAARFGLDAVLGAFLAGVVLRHWAPGDVHSLEAKLDVVGYGFFIPVFFVVSGMTLDVRSIVENPLRMLVFLVLLLAVRGLPALLVYRRALPIAERTQLMFITATALPLLVAVSEIGLRNGTMLRENAAALVGAGVLSVLIFPTAAVAVRSRAKRQAVATQSGTT
jgi:Kef-type K+ transport system membrane component KefB